MKEVMKTVLLIGALNVPTATLASEENSGFVVRGMGVFSCADVVDALTGSEPDLITVRYVAWLSGYLSHASRAHPKQSDALPFPDIDGFATVVARICESNPALPLETVTYNVLAILAEVNTNGAEAALAVEHNGLAMLLRPSVLEAVQRRLIQRGLLAEGQADGIFGPRSAEAITAFQESVGLEQTGLPDAWTIFVLLQGV